MVVQSVHRNLWTFLRSNQQHWSTEGNNVRKLTNIANTPKIARVSVQIKERKEIENMPINWFFFIFMMFCMSVTHTQS